jgi:hypothetical protein
MADDPKFEDVDEEGVEFDDFDDDDALDDGEPDSEEQQKNFAVIEEIDDPDVRKNLANVVVSTEDVSENGEE